ncbi:PTS system mannose/fructose/sorbose family transporter subunit IID [Pyxidicoccus xibeiensis]|uniref:PTS system mannose/fructose/sorbose family transporter subunit IID n=1 Tax=Pyxidicoccus xibeiensis TaxID=2906759 RepID=UPI0020A7C8AD|nr:PTS system mannose/fructose/sorbose family transporter subunit IID [Pyxidicoccus xibeiensis]MCP3139282.1 PTS system mannose/fructose/sorbose family transporter subunit IID [Pyxidicoccus xibeiensis]
MSAPEASLPLWVLVRVFLRSLFLQASWNPKGMQNLGLAYAVFPALERLYPAGASREEAVRRHLVFFNTHPYVAAAIVGGVVYHEVRIARDEETPDKVVAFKAALMGPLAALGDGFFWLSLKPAAGAVSVALVPLLGVWAVPLFLVLYNLVHVLLRVRLYWLGLTLGDRLVEAVARANLPARGAKLRAVAALSAGGMAAWLAISFGTNAGGASAPFLAAGCLALGVASYVLVSRRVPNYVVLYLAAGLACVAGAFL